MNHKPSTRLTMLQRFVLPIYFTEFRCRWNWMVNETLKAVKIWMTGRKRKSSISAQWWQQMVLAFGQLSGKIVSNSLTTSTSNDWLRLALTKQTLPFNNMSVTQIHYIMALDRAGLDHTYSIRYQMHYIVCDTFQLILWYMESLRDEFLINIANVLWKTNYWFPLSYESRHLS